MLMVEIGSWTRDLCLSVFEYIYIPVTPRVENALNFRPEFNPNSNTKFGLNSGLKFRAFSTRGVTGILVLFALFFSWSDISLGAWIFTYILTCLNFVKKMAWSLLELWKSSVWSKNAKIWTKKISSTFLYKMFPLWSEAIEKKELEENFTQKITDFVQKEFEEFEKKLIDNFIMIQYWALEWHTVKYKA